MQPLITFDGIESSQSFLDYINEKLAKHSKLLEDATGINVVFRGQVHARGVKNDFMVMITVSMPHKVIRVEEKSDEMYKAIDAAEETLFRRLKKYKDMHQRIAGKSPWKEI